MNELQIRPGVPYALTISPNYRQGNPYKDRIEDIQDNFIKWFAETLQIYGHSQIFTLLYPDIGQPLNFSGYKTDVPGAKMHLHGIIYFGDWPAIIHWYMKLSKIIAFGPTSHKRTYDLCSAIIDIDTIGDIGIWYSYCIKSLNTMWLKKQCLTNMSDPLFEWIMDYIPDKSPYTFQ